MEKLAGNWLGGYHSFPGDAVNVWRFETPYAQAVCADVHLSHIVAKDDEDVGLLGSGLSSLHT
jgi:hypothetical protein